MITVLAIRCAKMTASIACHHSSPAATIELPTLHVAAFQLYSPIISNLAPIPANQTPIESLTSLIQYDLPTTVSQQYITLHQLDVGRFSDGEGGTPEVEGTPRAPLRGRRV